MLDSMREEVKSPFSISPSLRFSVSATRVGIHGPRKWVYVASLGGADRIWWRTHSYKAFQRNSQVFQRWGDGAPLEAARNKKINQLPSDGAIPSNGAATRYIHTRILYARAVIIIQIYSDGPGSRNGLIASARELVECSGDS